MIDLQLVFVPGPHDDPTDRVELARELKELLCGDLSVPVTIRSAERTIRDQSRHDSVRGDAVAVAALILSIPGAALAIHDLAARTKLKDCLHRVLIRARERRAQAIWRSSADHVALPDISDQSERALDEVIDELVRDRTD